MEANLEKFEGYRHPEVDYETFAQVVPFIIERTTARASLHGTQISEEDIVKELIRLQGFRGAQASTGEEVHEPKVQSHIKPSQQRALTLGRYSLVETVRSLGQTGSFGPRGLSTLSNIKKPRNNRRKK